MRGINAYHPTMVHTHRGLIEMRDIIPGDRVYEYGTSRQVTVLKAVFPEVDHLYKIEYVDKRTQIVMEHSAIFEGNSIVRIRDAFNLLQKVGPFLTYGDIKTFPIDFVGKRIYTRPFPDPLVAGALLTYGDYDDPYINLPSDRDGINDHFAHRYNLDYANYLEHGKVYFKFNGAPEDSRITWKEFFPSQNMFVTSRCFNDPLIPIEYQRASIADRWHYVQGAFEIGYSQKMFPNSVSIAHTSERRLEELQKMLWSLGIMSKISYDPSLEPSKERQYRLDLIGKFEGYPGFFYNVENIEHISNNDWDVPHPDRYIPFAISSIDYMTEGVVGNLILDRPRVVYTEGNFTPRVSI